ncbi:MAG: hypothetical protein U5O39_01230 [Gammaproteobacteria bacterium]|nr:hypothetical protein [Gammaproteobacteria bacterium]
MTLIHLAGALKRKETISARLGVLMPVVTFPPGRHENTARRMIFCG